jgi:hypothetical protein
MSDKYWVAAINSNFNSSINWSSSTGGSPGASVPDSSDTAYFDGAGLGSCSLDTTVNVEGIRVTSGYTGVISQAGNPIIIGISDASFEGGYFKGDSSPFSSLITIYGSLYVGATADFTNTFGLMTVYKDFQLDSLVAHNRGIFRAMTTSSIGDSKGNHFHDLTIDNDSTPAGYRHIDSSAFIENKLTLSGGYLQHSQDGTLNAWGDIYCNQNFGKWSDDDLQINMNSSGAQNIFTTGGILPQLYVDKTTENQVKLFGVSPLYINGNLVIHDGTVNTNGLSLQVGLSVGVP